MNRAIPDRRLLASRYNPAACVLWAASMDVRDVGMGRADDPDIAAHARAQHLCLLTEDWGFGDIRVYPPAQYFGIVVIRRPTMASTRSWTRFATC
jgi:predicted nuclease of predicted toxin-antitoxin system